MDLEERVLALKSKTTGSLSYTAQKITDKIIDELVLTVFTELIDSNILWIDFLVFYRKYDKQMKDVQHHVVLSYIICYMLKKTKPTVN